MGFEQIIADKARELGITKCAMIPVSDMAGYSEKLQERIDKIPGSESMYARFRDFADIKKNFPWAESLIVIVLSYGHYKVPEESIGRFGKAYMFDFRFNQASPERQKIAEFESFLNGLGLRLANEERSGITAVRWAAYMAGLGTIRRNNFFYTDEYGSWSRIVAWATDQVLEKRETDNQKACPDNCNKCVKACPTGALFAPYTMNMATCASRLTTNTARELYDDDMNAKLGGLVYGCDICQDVCPNNKGKWKDWDEFPGMNELAKYLTPEAILDMDYEEIERVFGYKFFYLPVEALFRWKVNAINALVNIKGREAEEDIGKVTEDADELVRDKAVWAIQKIASQKGTIDNDAACD
jgi:epoxyqueuosine reductase